jgi:hypothetical protein
MNKNEEEEDLGGTETKAPAAKNRRPKEEKAKPMKPLPKRKQKKVGDEDFEEGAEGYDDNDADFEGGLEGEEEVFAEDGEYNEEAIEENPNEEEGGNEENNEEEEQQEENNEEEQASQASSKRRFRSNYANMMSELQGGVLTGEPEATFGFQEAEEDHGDQAAPPPKRGVKETSNRLLGKETKEVKDNKEIVGAGAKGKFVPYEYINSVDGDTAQMQRQKVTKGVTDFLKAADEKRKRQMETGTKKKSYIEDNVQDQNEYSDRMEYVNTRVKAKIAAMRNIINGSKATTVQQNQILDVEEINSADSIEDIDDFERYVKK